MSRRRGSSIEPTPVVRGFLDASVFLSVYTTDFFHDWARDVLEKCRGAILGVTCDLCVGEVVTNVLDMPHIGTGIWHAALEDFTVRLGYIEILRVRSQTSKCASKVHDIIDIQYKDKVWVTTALEAGVTDLFTTDRAVYDNRNQLTAASQAIKGRGVTVHSPYR
jgi:predicted nucleic acid-binding protein